ncbi:MAG: WxcM-like domain-containing protein [Candidatus Aenigmarchaeota archaeon]|nr:WxcM-like domain-containing protein [Candidatus Aenigmarchaeota archaeon]
MNPVHENESGLFQEIAKKNEVIFGQLSFLIIKPGHSRGNHYHKRKVEWFCCLHGKCELLLTEVNKKSKRCILLDSSNRELVKVNPFENHILNNKNNAKDCEILIIISEEYDESDPDTFKFEE